MIQLRVYPLRDGEDSEFEDFIQFLTERLIPDLRESEQDNLADDFEKCVEFMTPEPVKTVSYEAGTPGQLIGEDIEREANEYDGKDVDFMIEVRCDPDDQRGPGGR